MKRAKVAPDTVTVNGSKWKPSSPAWTGLYFDHAKPRTQSTMMMAVCGSDEAPLDIHLDVPWCHPSDRSGTEEDWTDCIYRVRPRMEVGKKWKGEKVTFVAFENWHGTWYIAYDVAP